MKKTLVHIKGTKNGIVLKLDDQCSYAELIEELTRKMSDDGLDGKVDVQLHLGYRYCHADQVKELIKIVQKSGQMLVSKVQSDVLSVEESNRRFIEKQCDTYVGVVRSGQVLKVDGDIVIVGNINQNGIVEASGSIYVLGKLKGIAHAGADGNREAVVAASFLQPTRVMIADEQEELDDVKKPANQSSLSFAFIGDNGRISYAQIRELKKIRPSFNTSRGGQ